MVRFSIVEIITIINILHLLLFSIFLFSRKKGPVLSYRLLGAAFLSLGLNLWTLFSFHQFEFMVQHYPGFIYIGAPFAFLYPVFFYFYIKSALQSPFIFKTRDALHFLPFLIFFIFLTVTHYVLPADIQREQLLHMHVISFSQKAVLTAMLHLQILTYVFSAVRLFRKHQSAAKNFYSSAEKINIDWIRFLFIGLVILWSLDISRFILYHLLNTFSLPIEAFLLTSFLVMIYLMLYKVITQPDIFSGMEDKTLKRTFLSDAMKDRYTQKLLSCMESEEPYLNPDLTIMDLSDRTCIPQRALSELINNTMNKNFYDFINEYRIRKAQQLLLSPDFRNRTILGILYEAGFNSKSVFNSAFKKATGMTPSQFKKHQNN